MRIQPLSFSFTAESEMRSGFANIIWNHSAPITPKYCWFIPFNRWQIQRAIFVVREFLLCWYLTIDPSSFHQNRNNDSARGVSKNNPILDVVRSKSKQSTLFYWYFKNLANK